jgi:DNA-binding NtrC family response regulator
MSDPQMPPIRTLLIVDDEADLRYVLETEIRALGIHSIAVGSAEEALAVIGSSPIHAVLCDVNLPRMDGFDLATHVRRSGSKLPFVFLTGAAAVNGRDRADQLGACDFLAKPVELSDLQSTVERALDQGLRRVGRGPLGTLRQTFPEVAEHLDRLLAV